MRLVLGGIAVLLAGGLAGGFDPPPARSYTKPTPDGRHVLVMLVPKAVRDGADDDLRKKYGQAGLYVAGDPTRPRWTGDWYVQFDSGVQPSNDAVFAVRVPDRRRNWRQITGPKYRVPAKPAGFPDWAALIVYQNGEPARTHRLKDLFDCSAFTDADCDGGPVCEIDAFADAAGLVTVRTTAGGVTLRRTVHFRTGEVLPAGTAVPNESAGTGEALECRVGEDERTVPSVPERSWVRVTLIGAGVVGTGTAAFLALAVALLRGQRGQTTGRERVTQAVARAR